MKALREISAPLSRREAPSPTRTKPVHAPAPLDLGTLDHLEKTRNEVVAAVRGINPQAGPAPHDERVYQWAEEAVATLEAATPHLNEIRHRTLEGIAYRHVLEHAVRVGEVKVMRKLACPNCCCFGLLWNQPSWRATCINIRCLDGEGRQNTWTLAQIAHHHIAARPATRTATS